MSTNVAPDFEAYPKTPRLFRDIVITEKLDGTNSQIVIEPVECVPTWVAATCENSCRNGELIIRAGSRNRWITPKDDNYGFAHWVAEHKEELATLGVGRHFGEWWGQGIQRNYGLTEKRFSLFNVGRWADGAVTADKWEKGKLLPGGQPLPPRPACCGVVPVLYRGPFDTRQIQAALEMLAVEGSAAVPGFMRPEGIVVFHTAANRTFKVLLENDECAKGE